MRSLEKLLARSMAPRCKYFCSNSACCKLGDSIKYIHVRIHFSQPLSLHVCTVWYQFNLSQLLSVVTVSTSNRFICMWKSYAAARSTCWWYHAVYVFHTCINVCQWVTMENASLSPVNMHAIRIVDGNFSPIIVVVARYSVHRAHSNGQHRLH